MKPDRLTAYLRLARSIAKEYGTHPVWALFRLRYAWLRYGFDAGNFIRYGFYPQGLAAPGAYIKKREMESLQRRVNPRECRDIVDNKIRFHERCTHAGLPSPPILGLVGGSDRLRTTTALPKVATSHELLTLLDRNGAGTYLCKPVFGFLAEGITRFRFRSGSLMSDAGEPLDAERFVTDLLGQNTGLVLQPYLSTHPDLAPIMPGGCLGTSRIVTLTTNGHARVLFACTKIPVGNNATDNFLSGTSGNLIANVDAATGVILKVFGPKNRYPGVLHTVTSHPESGIPLPGFAIPRWHEIVATVLQAARAFSELGTIGWDIALTDQGPSLIEGNARWGPDPHQVALERGLKDELTRLFAPVRPQSETQSGAVDDLAVTGVSRR